MRDGQSNSHKDDVNKLIYENREHLNTLCEMRIASGETLGSSPLILEESQRLDDVVIQQARLQEMRERQQKGDLDENDDRDGSAFKKRD